MQRTMELQAMLEDGFTERSAKDLLNAIEMEKASGLFDADYMAWSHSQGFLAESACAYGLTEDNVEDYLSDYDTWKLWPLNDWQRIWINDKLTLNAMLKDTEMQGYLPEYYFYTAKNRILPLQPYLTATIDCLLDTLEEKQEFACKPCNGGLAQGFHKLECKDGVYYIDGQAKTRDQMAAEVADMKNYIFQEFIRPSAEFAAINSRIHTLRVLVINEDGLHPTPVASYLRFAVDEDGFKPNYKPPTDAETHSFNAFLDVETGQISRGTVVYANKKFDSPQHPVSGVTVARTVTCWPEVRDMIQKVCLKVGACEYMGFDIGFTDKGPRIMEINSDSGTKYLQLFTPLMANPRTGAYYRRKLADIAALDADGVAARNRIVR